MLKVGITGSIGSGKSTAAGIFGVLGIPVYDSDGRAKHLMHNDPELKQNLEERFGTGIFDEKGRLKSKQLAQIVFQDREALEALNGLVHPRVREDFADWSSQFHEMPYIIQEAALLVETGSYLNLDRLITVTAPEETRIERIMKRDQADRESVKARMKNQLPQSEKVAKSDFVINNDGTELVIPQVLEIDQTLKGTKKTGTN